MKLILPAWAKWAAVVVAGLALYVAGRMDGAATSAAELADYKRSLAEAQTALHVAQARVVFKTEIEYRDRIQIVKEKGDVIVKEVPVYITAETDRRFPLPVGFVRVHDAAAAGEPAGSAGGTDGEVAAVTPSAAASTIAANYADCLRYAEQVTGWQAFYDRLKNTKD